MESSSLAQESASVGSAVEDGSSDVDCASMEDRMCRLSVWVGIKVAGRGAVGFGMSGGESRVLKDRG